MKILFIKFAVMALALVGTISAKAQTVMSLHDCMAYAVSNSTKMRIQQAAVGDAQIDRRDAALKLFTPQINAQTYAYYNFGRSIDPQTNTYFNTTSFHNNYGVSAGYDLFDGFQAVNNYKISKTGMLIADSQEKQVEADICLAVMEAYYNVVYYKRLCDVYEEQVTTAESALAKARRQEELGQKGHADVIQMEADLADRQYDLTNTYNMYQDQKMTLADLMFWPLDEDLNIDTSMPVWEVEPVSTNSVVDFALDHNPAVQIASWKQLNAKRELNTAKWQLLPTVGLYAGWSTSYYTYQGSQTASFGDQFRNNGGEYVELSLSIPIWNRLNKQSTIARRQNALDRATAEYDQKRRDVESEVRRAIQDRDGAATAYLQAQRRAEVQAEAYTLNLKKLEQGLISPLEFQAANNNYLKAQADEMNSLFKYLIKQAVVRYYNGVEYINQ
jgi:outer membrane protein